MHAPGQDRCQLNAQQREPRTRVPSLHHPSLTFTAPRRLVRKFGTKGPEMVLGLGLTSVGRNESLSGNPLIGSLLGVFRCLFRWYPLA